MYDDDYEIPGAFPAMGNPAMGGVVAPNSSKGGGGGWASLFDNPMVMGGMMGLSNLRDPNSMSKAMQAMMDMRQSQQMMDYRNRSLDETSRYHSGALDVEKARAEQLRLQTQGQLDQQRMVQGLLPTLINKFQQNGQQPAGATAQVMQPPPVSNAQPMNNPSAFVAQGGNPAERPEQNNDMTAPVFGNEVQGQPLPPMGQPQPAPGGNNAPQFPSSAQSGMGVDQAPPSPDLIKTHYRTAVVGAEGGTNPDGSFRTSVKGAIGPGQVMPGTAPEAARLAGLPFDDNKYRTDKDYNLALGEAYYKKQFDTFGNIPMADAAYNAGPGALLAAQNRATKMGNPNAWLSFMPPETQKYVQKTTGFTGGMIPQQLSKAGVTDAQAQMQPPPQAQQAPPDQSQWAMQQAPPQAAPQAPEGIAQVPGLPQVPGMPQQPSGQQGVTAPDDSQQRRDQVAMGLVLTANPATMAEGLKMINAASETKTYNKGQIVTNADGKPIMVDGPPTVQEAFNNSIAAGNDYRQGLKTAMEVGKYPRELKQMDAQYQQTLAQTDKDVAQAAHARATTTEEIQKTEQTSVALEQGVKTFEGLTDKLNAKYARLKELGEIPDREKDTKYNLIAAAKASGPGQAAGRAAGTEAAGIRDEIANTVPLILASLKQAAGMGATQLNSNVEMGMYAKAATDPTKDIQSNLEAVQNLKDLYGRGIAEIRAKTRAATPGNPGAVLPPVTIPGAGASGTPEKPMSFDDARKFYRKQ